MHDEYLREETSKETKNERHFSMFAKPETGGSPRAKHNSSPSTADVSMKSPLHRLHGHSHSNTASNIPESETSAASLANGERRRHKSGSADKSHKNDGNRPHTSDSTSKSKKDKVRLDTESKADSTGSLHITGKEKSDNEVKKEGTKDTSAKDVSDKSKECTDRLHGEMDSSKLKETVIQSDSQTPGCSGMQDLVNVSEVKEISGCDSYVINADTKPGSSTQVRGRSNIKIGELRRERSHTVSPNRSEIVSVGSPSNRNQTVSMETTPVRNEKCLIGMPPNRNSPSSVECTPNKNVTSSLEKGKRESTPTRDFEKKPRNGITVEERKMRIKRSLSPGFYNEDIEAIKPKRQRQDSENVIACKKFSNSLYSKTCVKRSLSKRPKNVFQDQLSLIAGQGTKILHLSCRTSDLQFSIILQTHALVRASDFIQD